MRPLFWAALEVQVDSDHANWNPPNPRRMGPWPATDWELPRDSNVIPFGVGYDGPSEENRS